MNKAPGMSVGSQETISLFEQEKMLKGITDLVAEIKVHNDNHGVGAMLGKALAGVIVHDIKPQEGEENKSTEDVVRGVQSEIEAGGHAGLVALKSRNESTLKEFGLSLDHQRSHYDPNESLDTIVFKVVDVKKFISSIEMLKHAIKAESIDAVFKTVLENLLEQVYFTNQEDVLDAGGNINSNLTDISKAFHDALPGMDLIRLDTYAKFKGEGRLKNYIAVEKENLWAEPGKNFGPADWVRDISPEGLEKKWDHALGVLSVQDLEKERGVAPELREHLLKCITSAFETSKSSPWAAEFEPILIKYTQKIVGNNSLN
ncbi:MAG: hypothetical protein KBC50_03205 [Candidatus Pacebacteria bacterium]|nr:hypothetical protein [Candidatus Paceibacterota bacterium]